MYRNRLRAIVCVLLGLLLFNLFTGCSKDSLENRQPADTNLSSALVFGSLFNADEGQFVRQADIQILPGFAEVQSDDDGNFIFEDVGRGEFQILARKGNYRASTYVSTLSTDFISVDMTFGTTARNHNDLTFSENDFFVTKKLQDNKTPEFYSLLVNGVSQSFIRYGKMDWHPLKPDELIFSAQELGQTFNIYRLNLESNEIFTLVEDVAFDSTNPSYSPDGKRFSYLKDGQVYIADSTQTSSVSIPRQMIRDGRLILRNLTSNKIVLKMQERNEQIQLPQGEDPPEVLPSIPVLPMGFNPIISNGNNIVAVAQFRNLLNRYFNVSCFDNLGGIQTCLNTIDQFCDGSNNIAVDYSDCAMVFDQQGVAGQNFGSTDNYNQISFLDALNFPAECPVEMKDPVWSRSGNQIAFLARPTGCSSQRPTVCGRSCGDQGWDIYLSPADANRENVEFRNRFTNNEIERMDKFQVIQITNDEFVELDLSWDPQSNAILYDKVRDNNGSILYYLQSSNPTSLGFQTRVLLKENPVRHYAQISQDGSQIVFVSRVSNRLNPNGFSQVYTAPWSGVVGKETPVTFYQEETLLKHPNLYKVRERAFTKN